MSYYISHLGHNQALSIAELYKALKATDMVIHHGGYLSFSSIYSRGEIQAKFSTLGGQRLIAEIYKDHVPSGDQDATLLAAIDSTIGENKYQFAPSRQRLQKRSASEQRHSNGILSTEAMMNVLSQRRSPFKISMGIVIEIWAKVGI